MCIATLLYFVEQFKIKLIVSRFLASLTDIKHKLNGKTVLYIPNEGTDSSANTVAKNKELVQRLESKFETTGIEAKRHGLCFRGYIRFSREKQAILHIYCNHIFWSTFVTGNYSAYAT